MNPFDNAWKDPVTGKKYSRSITTGKYHNSETGEEVKIKKKQSSLTRNEEQMMDLSFGSKEHIRSYQALYKFNMSLDDAILYDLHNSFIYKISRGKLKEWIRLKLRSRSKKKYERAILDIIKTS